jgi:hypothetical protein
MELKSHDIETWRWRIREVTDGLFISGDLHHSDDAASAQLADWVTAGVTHILDVRQEWSDKEFVAACQPEVGYRHLGTHDDGGEQSNEWFDAGARYACTVDRPGNGLLVHCHMGINRGPSMAFAILLDRGWSTTDALDAIAAARPIAAISYADDAVRWFADRRGLSVAHRDSMLSAVRQWQRAAGVDVERVIRAIRHGETADEEFA